MRSLRRNCDRNYVTVSAVLFMSLTTVTASQMRSQMRRSIHSIIYMPLTAITASQLRAVASQNGQCAQLRRSR